MGEGDECVELRCCWAGINAAVQPNHIKGDSRCPIKEQSEPYHDKGVSQTRHPDVIERVGDGLNSSPSSKQRTMETRGFPELAPLRSAEEFHVGRMELPCL